MKKTLSFSCFVFLIYFSFNLQSQCLLTSSITPGNSISICPGSSLCIPAQAGSNYQWMQNPTWNDLGNPLFSAGQSIGNVIAIDTGGVPYVAYKDVANASKCTVMKLSAGTWVNVGIAGFTPGAANYISLAIDNSGTPYVAFMDGSASAKISVMKFNGTNWVFVGPQGFNPGIGGAWYNGIAFDVTGTPYVSFRDNSTAAGNISVMKFNGSSWTFVGTQGFSAGQADYTWIQFDPSGTTPYVVYTDAVNSSKLTAMKFNGSSWVGVGPPGFTANTCNDHGIGFDKTGTLHVCIQDGASTGVMKFNGSSWVYVGASAFSGCCTGTFDHGISFDAANTPYVAFVVGNGVECWRYNGTTWFKVGATILNPGSAVGIVMNKQGIPYVSYVENLSGARARVRKFDGTNVGANSTCFSPTVAGTYIVDVTQGCGGSLALNVVTITAINPNPTITVNSGTICSGKSFTITPSGASSYTYISGGPVVSPTTSTSYSVTGTSSLGCVSSNTAISIINVNPTPTVSITGSLSICNGNATVLSANGASSYSWNTSATTSSISVSPTVTTTYSVTGTGTNACASTSSNTVIVNPLPIVSVNSGTICEGQSFTITASGAATYTYSSGTSVVSPTTNTSYSVTGTSSLGCISSITAISNVSVNPSPVISVNNGTICTGETFTMIPSGASTYTFSSGSATVSPTSNTSYSVTGTNSLGCTSNTALSTVSVNPSPTISISGTFTFCIGDSTIISANGASSYTWNTGPVTNSISVSPTINTTYSVNGTDVNGCSGNNTVTITVNNLPILTAISTTSLLCTGQSSTLTIGGASTYTWNTGSNNLTIVISPTITTNYTVSGTDGNGCSNFTTITQSVSACTFVKNASSINSEVKMYPNPFNSKFTIETNSPSQIFIYDLTGRIILKDKTSSDKLIVDMSEYPSAIYYLKIVSVWNERVVKLVKE